MRVDMYSFQGEAQTGQRGYLFLLASGRQGG